MAKMVHVMLHVCYHNFFKWKKKTKKERTFSLSHIVLQFSLSTGITFFSSGAQGLKAFSNHFCCSQALFILSIRFRQGLYSSDFQLWIYWCELPWWLRVKNMPASAGDTRDVGSTLRWGRFPGGGYGHLLQYSCLENPLDRGAWGLQSTGSQRVRHCWSDWAASIDRGSKY